MSDHRKIPACKENTPSSTKKLSSRQAPNLNCLRLGTHQSTGLNRASLTSRHLLQLQSIVGNQAVVQLLSADSSSDKLPSNKAEAIPEPTVPQPSNETGLPDNLKDGIEKLSGFDMSTVRVHYNSPKPSTLQAFAYTQGSDIHLGPGQERHLPHEAWHVVQQIQGRVKPTLQAKGLPINADTALESEATTMGEKASNLTFSLGNIQRKQISTPLLTPIIQRALNPDKADEKNVKALIDDKSNQLNHCDKHVVIKKKGIQHYDKLNTLFTSQNDQINSALKLITDNKPFQASKDNMEVSGDIEPVDVYQYSAAGGNLMLGWMTLEGIKKGKMFIDTDANKYISVIRTCYPVSNFKI